MLVDLVRVVSDRWLQSCFCIIQYTAIIPIPFFSWNEDDSTPSCAVFTRALEWPINPFSSYRSCSKIPQIRRTRTPDWGVQSYQQTLLQLQLELQQYVSSGSRYSLKIIYVALVIIMYLFIFGKRGNLFFMWVESYIRKFRERSCLWFGVGIVICIRCVPQ